MFPPKYLDAVKLTLLNEPVYHGKQTAEAVSQKLQKDGEFLLQDGDNANTVILSVFKEVVRDFLITIEQVGESHRFVIGNQRFESISEMISELKSVRSGSETLKLETAVCRNDDMGRFGACCVIDDFPRETMKTLIPLPRIKQKSVLVILRKTIVQMDNDEDLESLMLLKHKHLIRLEDFAIYRNHLVILRYEMHENTTLYEILTKKNVVELSLILKWIQQAASLAFYLAKQGCFNSMLCAQDCYLDANQNIKFRGAWNTFWPTWQEETLRHAFYWRFVAPETLLYQRSFGSSIIWNLGVFMWQLTVSCRLTPFFQDEQLRTVRYRSRQSYLDAILSGSISLVDYEHDVDSVDMKMLKDRANIPPSIDAMISQCVQLQSEERCLWSTILGTTKRERAVAAIGGTVKRFFPFM